MCVVAKRDVRSICADSLASTNVSACTPAGQAGSRGCVPESHAHRIRPGHSIIIVIHDCDFVMINNNKKGSTPALVTFQLVNGTYQGSQPIIYLQFMISEEIVNQKFQKRCTPCHSRLTHASATVLHRLQSPPTHTTSLLAVMSL